MLQALDVHQQTITLAAMTKAEIQSQRKQQHYCPVCGLQVIVKAGEHTIPHFAHRHSSSCPSAQKGEGPFHEKGKVQLFQWLQRDFVHVKLEKYLPQIKQRPDILLFVGSKAIAIEFQCAKISLREIKKRNQHYQMAGIQPIWILGANLLRQSGKNQLHVNPFLLTFLHQFKPAEPDALYFYCSNTQKMIRATDVFMTSLHRAMANFFYDSLDTIRLTDIFRHASFNKGQLIHHWQKEKRFFRLRPRRRTTGTEEKWQHWLYNHHLTVESMPSIVYLPVPSAYLFHSTLWNWQSRICLDFLQEMPINACFTLSVCEKFLHEHILHLSHFPLLNSFGHPLKEYLTILNKLQVIFEYKPNHYRKLRDIYYPDHIETALNDDQQLLDRLLHDEKQV